MTLHTWEITGMRSELDALMPDTLTTQRPTSTSDSGGGFTDSYANNLTGVRCRISPVGGGEDGTRGDRVSDESTHIVTCPAATDVAEKDRIVIAGVTYEVTLVRKREAWELSRRVEVREAP